MAHRAARYRRLARESGPRATSSSYPLRRTRNRPNSKSALPKDDELRQMRGWAVGGVLVMTIVGDMSDGAIALIDLSSSPVRSVHILGPTRHQMFSDKGNVVLAACPLESGARVRILPGLTV